MRKILAVVILFSTFLFAQSPIPSDAKLEKVFSSGKQLEGPVWKDGLGLLFSDIKTAKIYLLPADGSPVKTYLEKSDSSNGLTLDKNNSLVLTQMGKRRIARQESNGNITVLASTYNGKKFNSPNDLVVKSDGSIFFTDPDFNIPGGASKKELTFQGIYRISPNGTLQLLNNSYTLPNGICFSPDEKKLYVNESQKGEIYVWDIINDSTIANKNLFNKVTPYADGMKVDNSGNLYCTGSGGISIFSPAGNFLAKIATTTLTTENPSNCAWGDSDKKTLYITTNSNLLKIRLVSTGIEEHGNNLPDHFELYPNYPNPFNPTTAISYQISTACQVTLKVFNLLGKEIDTLVNEIKQPGVYNSQFSIHNFNFPSGIYFYTLRAGNFSQTRKMVVMK